MENSKLICKSNFIFFKLELQWAEPWAYKPWSKVEPALNKGPYYQGLKSLCDFF